RRRLLCCRADGRDHCGARVGLFAVSAPWRIFCDDAELAVECARAALPLGLAVAPEIAEDALERARSAASKDELVAAALSSAPSPAALARLAARSRSVGATVPIAVVASREERALLVASDLGLPAVSEVRPLLSVMALLSVAAAQPWTASARGLTALDRAR